MADTKEAKRVAHLVNRSDPQRGRQMAGLMVLLWALPTDKTKVSLSASQKGPQWVPRSVFQLVIPMASSLVCQSVR